MTAAMLDEPKATARRSIAALLAPLEELAEHAGFVRACRYGSFGAIQAFGQNI